VRRIFFAVAVVFLVSGAIALCAQEAPTPASTKPAASRSQADCTGFIAPSPLSDDLSVIGGEDDDTHSPVREFVPGQSVFISSRGHEGAKVGAEYSVFRPAEDIFHTERYTGQASDLRKLGHPYDDVGRVTITHVNPDGIVARIMFACSPVVAGDLLLPFEPRAIPEYELRRPLDHFAPLVPDKAQGIVVGARDNFGFIRNANVVYLNLGQDARVKPGDRFRVFRQIPLHETRLFGKEMTPPEILGEVVVLTVQLKSCVGIVVASYREISAGDGVQLE